jgi:hypothetical protein
MPMPGLRYGSAYSSTNQADTEHIGVGTGYEAFQATLIMFDLCFAGWRTDTQTVSALDGCRGRPHHPDRPGHMVVIRLTILQLDQPAAGRQRQPANRQQGSGSGGGQPGFLIQPATHPGTLGMR